MRTPAIVSALLLALLTLLPRSLAPVAVAAVESVDQPIVALPEEVSGEKPIALPEAAIEAAKVGGSVSKVGDSTVKSGELDSKSGGFAGLPQDPIVIPPITPIEVPAPADPPKIDPEWVKSVYPVRMAYGVIGQQGSMTFDGCGVAVGPDKIHTAAHLTHQMPAGSRAEVLVDGEWKRANWSPVAGKDFAVAIVPGAKLNAVPVRVPAYGERVTVYGLKTKSFAQGTYVGATDIKAGFGLVPLDACETPIENGDSGGGVFGDDGCLLGTIRGCESDSKLVTTMTPIVADAPKATSQPAPTGSTPAPARAVQSCPGGVCPAPQSTSQTRTYFPKKRGRK